MFKYIGLVGKRVELLPLKKEHSGVYEYKLLK